MSKKLNKLNKSFLRLFRGEILEVTKRLLIMQYGFRMLVLRGKKNKGFDNLSLWILVPLAKGWRGEEAT